MNSPLPGSELTKEPFRWDQRLFALVLRLPGVASTEPEQIGSVPTDESAITQMCEVTGGMDNVYYFCKNSEQQSVAFMKSSLVFFKNLLTLLLKLMWLLPQVIFWIPNACVLFL